MIWYIIGGALIIAAILVMALGRKKKPKTEETESGQISGEKATTIEPTVEDGEESNPEETTEEDFSAAQEDDTEKTE